MFIEYHDGFANPGRTHVTRLVLTDDVGNPIVVAVDNGDSSFSVSTISDPDFVQSLRELGITKTVMVRDAEV